MVPVAEQQSLLRPMAGDVVAERARAFARELAAPPTPPVAPAPREPAPAAPAAPEPVQAPPAPLDPVQDAPADEADAGRSHPELPPRNYAAVREAIPTACGRLVIREYVFEPPPASPPGSKPTPRGFHLYQLLEPVLAGASYSETRTDRTGRVWGLARTRRPATPSTDYDAQVDHQLAQARRAVLVMRATVEELGLRDAHGRPGGVAECIYESRGDVILMTDPAAAARRFRDQRGAR